MALWWFSTQCRTWFSLLASCYLQCSQPWEVHNKSSFLVCCWDLLAFLHFHHHIFPLVLLNLCSAEKAMKALQYMLICCLHVNQPSFYARQHFDQPWVLCVYMYRPVCAYTRQGSVTEWLLAAAWPALLNLNEYFDSRDSLTDWTWLSFQTCANLRGLILCFA